MPDEQAETGARGKHHDHEHTGAPVSPGLHVTVGLVHLGFNRCGSGFASPWRPWYLKGTSGTEYDSLRIVSDKEGRMVRVVEWLDSGDEEEES